MDINTFIDDYLNWLKSEITFSQIGEYYELNTPFLDTNNDYIQFYVKQEKEELYFTDDGYTLHLLETAGLQLTQKRTYILNQILSQFGVQRVDDELTLHAPASQFPQKKHAFIQCLIRITDLYMTSKAQTSSLFLEDIQNFFAQNDIYCMENVSFTGKSGFSHNYDFAIQRSKQKPERLCLAINNPNKSSMGNALFAWNDTKPYRKKDSQLIVLLNDSNPISKGIEDGFSNYDVNTIRWSERKISKNLNLLTA